MEGEKREVHREGSGVPGVISLRDIKRLKDVLYEGQVIRCRKPYARSESNVEFVDCTARIVRKYDHHVQLEDLDPRARSRKIFSLKYVDLIGGFSNG